MRFGAVQRPRQAREAIVPMINVVFLLLIFFLMTATVALPPPFVMQLPEGVAPEEAGGPAVLFVGPDGTLAFGAARGEAVFAAIGDEALDAPLEIRADADLPAPDLAGILARLGETGTGETLLVLVRP